MRLRIPFLILALAGSAVAAPPGDGGEVQFNRDVRPILSENCFACHGPAASARKGKLRLDSAEDAILPHESGTPVVPGRPEQSEILARITSADPDEIMPPPKTGKKISPAQVQTLKRWIAQGAAWQKHWSLLRPMSPQVPAVRDAAWCRNEIDRFVLARLEAEGAHPSPMADRATLIRRLSFDLTGTPPTPAEVDAFVADPSEQAYGKLVDHLLDSPHYGERLALQWLDTARYADTNGYNNDGDRTMWRWRDWVIEAFNSNLPYDQFLTDQLAGDLLPGATLDQKIASGFNRNHPITTEGGAVDEEYRIEYVADRVQTTATAFLGLTMRCARCHDHKYDPISQKDYYRFFAFFNNVPEKGVPAFDAREPVSAPFILAPTHAQQSELDRLADRRREIERLMQGRTAAERDPFRSLRLTDAEERYRRLACETVQLAVRIVHLKATFPYTMVMQEMPTLRKTHLLHRGEYDKPGEVVTAGVPACFAPLPAGIHADRLALSHWMTDPANPLVARVAVNRLWQVVFGTGLVETAEDFGTQGEPPSQPELLDWLATTFVRSGWDTKTMLRRMVMSNTYRQSSNVSEEMLARDPRNRLLTRAARFRLPAEIVRDNALAVSGLLNAAIGGPSVFPYQPPGLWEEVSVSHGAHYPQNHGDQMYRRSLYSFWKRSSPPPALNTFDAADRETCYVRRSRTNTPLQALVLMNDPTYVEAARKLAERIMTTGGAAPSARLECGYKIALARAPRDEERSILLALFDSSLRRFQAEPKEATKLLAVGQSPRRSELSEPELAAWTTVASAILGLDETISRE